MTDRVQWDGTEEGARSVGLWLSRRASERGLGSLGVVYDESDGSLRLPVPQLYRPHDPKWETVEPGDWVMVSYLQPTGDQLAVRVGRLQPQQLDISEVDEHQLWQEIARRYDRPFIEQVLDDFDEDDREARSHHDHRAERRRLLLAAFQAFANEAGVGEAWTRLMESRRAVLDALEGKRT